MGDTGFMERLLDGADVAWVPLGEVVNTVTAPSKAKKLLTANLVRSR